MQSLQCGPPDAVNHSRAASSSPRPEPWRGRPRSRPPRGPVSPEGLTQQEVRIVVRAADGATDSEIAEQLGITENTVGTYWTRIYQRLGAARRAHAVAIVLRRQRDEARATAEELHSQLSKAEAALRDERERTESLKAALGRAREHARVWKAEDKQNYDTHIPRQAVRANLKNAGDECQ